jgi:hypothetical protein
VAAPPPRTPQKPGLPAARPDGEDAIQKSRREKDELEKEATRLEEELEELKAKYDMYFLGVERREPARTREELRKRVLRLKEAFTRNTGLKFRIQSLHARYLSYERLWLRSAKEKEEGTYRRDIFKARLHAANRGEPPLHLARKKAAAAKGKEAEAVAATPAPITTATPVPAATPRPGATPAPVGPAGAAAGARPAAPRVPAAGPPRPVTPPPRPGAMTDGQMRALYDAYVAAKRSCNEDTSRLTYDAVANTVSKQIPELINRFKAKTVEFKVEVKDGKAVLKAIPKV